MEVTIETTFDIDMEKLKHMPAYTEEKVRDLMVVLVENSLKDSFDGNKFARLVYTIGVQNSEH